MRHYQAWFDTARRKQHLFELRGNFLMRIGLTLYDVDKNLGLGGCPQGTGMGILYARYRAYVAKYSRRRLLANSLWGWSLFQIRDGCRWRQSQWVEYKVEK